MILRNSAIFLCGTNFRRLPHNVETNNNFEALAIDPTDHENKDATPKKKEEEVPKDENLDFQNYKEKLGEFIENYRENDEEEPKYFQPMKNMIVKEWNIFHISLLDVGKYNPCLKNFLSKNQKTLER